MCWQESKEVEMKQIFIKSGQVVVEEIPPPSLSDDSLLVANACSLISTGTEIAGLHPGGADSIVIRALRHPSLLLKASRRIAQKGPTKTLQQVRESISSLRPLGYSTAGIVIAVGSNVGDINAGDMVACGGGQFAYHAEVVAVSRNLAVKIPPNVTFEPACFTTLGAIAMHGIRKAGVQFGETIVVMGLGLLGLLAVQIARAGGYRVIGFDLDETRVALAQKLGVNAAFSPARCDPVRETKNLTNGFGADAVVIYAATKSSEVVNLAFDICRPKAKVVAVGAFGMNLDRSKMYQKELELLISTSYGPGRYDPIYEEQNVDYPIGYVRWTENRNMEEFLSLLSEGKIDVTPLIYNIYPVEDALKAYQLLQQPRTAPAVLLKYDYEKYVDKKNLTSCISTSQISRPKVEGKVRVAIVGAGSFIKAYRLPSLMKLNNYYHLRAISTTHGEGCKSLAEKYSADYATTDYREVFQDSEVDLVMIGTRHDLHYPIIMEALRAGKKVFTEKPLCLRPEELKDIIETAGETGLPVIVGFNRRYSPLVRVLKKDLEELAAPCFIQYRVNAGFIPKDHWSQDPDTGGGRIIGEACHFFDLADFLAGKDNAVIRVKAELMPVNGKEVIARENIVATLSYADGSLASLIYTTLGSSELEKERMEVFVGGRSFVLHDYRWLESYGFVSKQLKPKNGKMKGNRLILPVQDKGWEQELSELAKFLKGEKSQIISFDEVVRAMNTSFEVDRLVREI